MNQFARNNRRRAAVIIFLSRAENELRFLYARGMAARHATGHNWINATLCISFS